LRLGHSFILSSSGPLPRGVLGRKGKFQYFGKGKKATGQSIGYRGKKRCAYSVPVLRKYLLGRAFQEKLGSFLNSPRQYKGTEKKKSDCKECQGLTLGKGEPRIPSGKAKRTLCPLNDSPS